MKWFKKSEVALGEGSVTQYIVFEHKKLFSLIFYRWNTIDQVRFHTHAFAAVAFLLKGWYWEQVIFNKIIMQNFVNIPFLPRFLPKNYCHSVQNAKPGTMTMVITGPWQKYWFEYFPDYREHEHVIGTGKWVKYTWGRKKVGVYNELPEEYK